MIVFIITCIVLIIIGILIYLFPVIQTDGRSMLPTYKSGAYLLGMRLFKYKRLQIGKCYVYARYDTDGQPHVVIKRLTHFTHIRDEIYCYFEGDNEAESYDSRHYGFINAENIIAKVLWQIKK